MATTEEELALWIRRIAELERELDAATKLAEVKAIAAELRQTKAALKKAKAKAGNAVRHPRRASSRQSARRNESNAGTRGAVARPPLLLAASPAARYRRGGSSDRVSRTSRARARATSAHRASVQRQRQ
jgi:hypothetical protein